MTYSPAWDCHLSRNMKFIVISYTLFFNFILLDETLKSENVSYINVQFLQAISGLIDISGKQASS